MPSRTFSIKSDTLTPGLRAFFKKAGVGAADKESAHFKAREKAALSLLFFTVNGSAQEKTVPPIRWGILRGSGSAFVDGWLVGDTKSSYADGTPNLEYRSPKDGFAVGFNTAYAARMHETKWVPGGKVPSKQAAKNPAMLEGVGNKFLEKHLRADAAVLLGTYAEVFRKEAGTG